MTISLWWSFLYIYVEKKTMKRGLIKLGLLGSDLLLIFFCFFMILSRSTSYSLSKNKTRLALML